MSNFKKPLILVFTEVLIKVQVFDNSDLSPLKESTVQVCGNQSILASSLAGGDGIVTLTFLYRPGTWVIVTASKHGFVTNSAPWHASRIPREYFLYYWKTELFSTLCWGKPADYY